MKRLLISFALAGCFLIAAAAFGENAGPKLYLEIWEFSEVPDPLPTEVCVHTSPIPPEGIHCYSPKTAYYTAVVALHVGNLDQPVCPVPSAACEGAEAHGGYLGVPFGVMATGEAITFMSWTACPGFLKGPSANGEPEACLASSTKDCHDWQDHLGYLQYINPSSRTGMTMLAIVKNADLNLYNVINCHNEYDTTYVGGGAQWGGAQSIVCATTAVSPTTWGKIKSLFR